MTNTLKTFTTSIYLPTFQTEIPLEIDTEFGVDIQHIADTVAFSRGLRNDRVGYNEDIVKQLATQFRGYSKDLPPLKQKEILQSVAESLQRSYRTTYEQLSNLCMQVVMLRGMFTHPTDGAHLIDDLADEIAPPDADYWREIEVGVLKFHRVESDYEKRIYYVLKLLSLEKDIEDVLFKFNLEIEQWQADIKLANGSEATFQRLLLERNSHPTNDNDKSDIDGGGKANTTTLRRVNRLPDERKGDE